METCLREKERGLANVGEDRWISHERVVSRKIKSKVLDAYGYPLAFIEDYYEAGARANRGIQNFKVFKLKVDRKLMIEQFEVRHIDGRQREIVEISKQRRHYFL